jgi:oligopeptide/dipeptide ABC transporter ATP-binding protein
MKSGSIITEAIKVGSKDKLIKGKIDDKVIDLLTSVGLKDKKDCYPETLSGGEKRRISIIRAFALNPELIIADEPFSSFDASLRNEVLRLFLENQRERSYIFILHELDVAKYACETIVVMYLGSIVEIGRTCDILSNSLVKHPYTKLLLSAQHASNSSETLAKPIDVPSVNCGCAFRERCYLYLSYGSNGSKQDLYKKNICDSQIPELREIVAEHKIACHSKL